MALKDYYRLLGVTRETPGKEIKKAYRKLVMAYHPDRNRNDPNCEERLKEINEAYQVLGDEERRRLYDLSYAQLVENQVIYGRDLSDEIIIDLRGFSLGGFPRRGLGGCKRKGFGRRGCRRWP